MAQHHVGMCAQRRSQRSLMTWVPIAMQEDDSDRIKLLEARREIRRDHQRSQLSA